MNKQTFSAQLNVCVSHYIFLYVFLSTTQIILQEKMEVLGG